MKSAVPDLDPLASYLKPKFGDVYELPSTPELKSAIVRYLVEEVSDGGFAKLLEEEFVDPLPGSSRLDRAAALVAGFEPFDIAAAFHSLAVKAIPSFQQLMCLVSDHSLDLDDLNHWLYCRLTTEQLAAFLTELGADEATYPQSDDWWWLLEVPDWLGASPTRLLRAWKDVMPSEHPRDVQETRAWARQHGYRVGSRGRLSAEIIRLYRREQAGSPSP